MGARRPVRATAVWCLGSHVGWVFRWISFKMELPNIGFWIRLVLGLTLNFSQAKRSSTSYEPFIMQNTASGSSGKGSEGAYQFVIKTSVWSLLRTHRNNVSTLKNISDT